MILLLLLYVNLVDQTASGARELENKQIVDFLSKSVEKLKKEN